MGWILSPSEYMNMVFSKSQWYPCNKILLKCPLPTVLTVHHFKKNATKFPFWGQKYCTNCYFTLCCMFIRILVCSIINRYLELPRTLLICYKSDWGNLFRTYFGFCFLIRLLPRLHYHIYLCMFIFTWPSLVKGKDYWLINTICPSFFFTYQTFLSEGLNAIYKQTVLAVIV
jgi:hypothetical protein